MTNLSLIPSLFIALFLVAGGVFALIGSLGLCRFSDFTGRIHATTLGNTMGVLLVLGASIIMSWHINDRVFLHEVIIILFLFLTSPVSAMLLMRSYTLRQERMNKN